MQFNMLRRNCALGEIRGKTDPLESSLVPERLRHESVIVLMFLGIHLWTLVQKAQLMHVSEPCRNASPQN